MAFLLADDEKYQNPFHDNIQQKNDERVGRFNGSNSLDSSQPKSGYEGSNFRIEYKAFPKDNVNPKTVRGCLPYDVQKKFDEFSDNFNIEEKCVRIWTLQSPLYKTLTKALYQDDKYQIRKYIPLIRGINKYLVSPTNRSYITYRSSHMSDKQFNTYKLGNIYRAPSFVATSENESVTQNFSLKKAKDKYSIKFRIPKWCWNAAPISHLSAYPTEKEILLPAYTAFKVLDKTNNRIEVQVLDNRGVNSYNGIESRFV